MLPVPILHLGMVRHAWSSHLAQGCYSTAGPSHVSHYGTMLAGWSPIHVLTGLTPASTWMLVHGFVIPNTACLFCIWCSLHTGSGHRGNLFLQHLAACYEIFHSLVLHVLRCTVIVSSLPLSVINCVWVYPKG